MVDLQLPLTWQRSLGLIKYASASSERGGRAYHKRSENTKNGSRKDAVVSHSVGADGRKRRRQEESAAMMESKRRKQMANSFLNLKSLLPINILNPKMDKCEILREAEHYIAMLKAEIEVLKEKKQTLMGLPPPQGLFQAHKQEQEKEREEKEKEKRDQLWVEIIPDGRCREMEMEMEIFVTLCSSQKKRSNMGLSRILCVLEKANIEVINANACSNASFSFCLMLHGKIQGGSKLSTTLLKDQISFVLVEEA